MGGPSIIFGPPGKQDFDRFRPFTLIFDIYCLLIGLDSSVSQTLDPENVRARGFESVKDEMVLIN